MNCCTYFGARYYDPNISIWLSVDPLSDEAPGWTPYRYAFNNPIRIIDPNGMFEDGWEVNVETNEATRVNDKGGATEQHITYVNSAGERAPVGTEVIKGDGFSVENGRAVGQRSDGSPFHSFYAEPSTNPSTPAGGNGSSNGTGDAAPYVGGAMSVSSEVIFSKRFNTWIGKDGKMRSQTWGGNGRTGGKYKFARNTSRYFKWAGSAVGLYGVMDIEAQYANGQIGNTDRAIQQISNGLGFIPTFGTAWSIGWNLGKDYGPSTWFGKNDHKWFK